MTLDYRTNTAARTEGAFLTIVGSPVMSWADDSARSSAASNHNDPQGRSARRRHNIYIAWLSPRTKITENGHASPASETGQRRNESQAQGRDDNMPLSFDQLEVGDHVEVQFSMHEDSHASNGVHMNQQMRQRHGRHRTFVGYAMSITVMPEAEHDKASAAHDTKPNEKPNN